MNSTTKQIVHAVETIALSRRFGDLMAVDNIQLSILPGTLYGLIGRNGSGKTTTINMLTGMLSPSSGSARVLGFDVAKQALEIKRRIGVVPEQFSLFDRLTVLEHLQLVGRLHGLTGKTVEDRAQELLDTFDLNQRIGSVPAALSNGTKKLVSVACALLPGPSVLFLDEPFEGLDAIHAGYLRSILTNYVQSGATIILTSHVLEIVRELCTRVGIIEKGCLIREMNSHEYGDPATGAAQLESAIRTVSGKGAPELERRLSWFAGGRSE